MSEDDILEAGIILFGLPKARPSNGTNEIEILWGLWIYDLRLRERRRTWPDESLTSHWYILGLRELLLSEVPL